jgi:hypothetical protein
MKGMSVDGVSMVEIEAVTPSLRMSRRVMEREYRSQKPEDGMEDV